MKIPKSLKLDPDAILKLEKLSEKTGKSMAVLVEEAIAILYEQVFSERNTEAEIELCKKENEQLRLALQVLKERQVALEKVDEAYKKVEDTYKLLISEKDKVIEEKDKRINDLLEQVELLREKRRWWDKWFKR